MHRLIRFSWFGFIVLLATPTCLPDSPRPPQVEVKQEQLSRTDVGLRPAIDHSLQGLLGWEGSSTLGQFYDKDGEGRFRLLFSLREGVGPAGVEQVEAIKGLLVDLRRSRLWAVRATLDALRVLARHPLIERIEGATQLFPSRELADASVLVHETAVTAQDDTQRFTFTPAKRDATKDATVTIRVFSAYASKAKKPELLPELKLCQDTTCTVYTATDVGSYDRTLPQGLVDPTPKPLSHAVLSHTFKAKAPGSLSFEVKGWEIEPNGRFFVVISSKDILLTQKDLVGKSVTATQFPRIMGHASAQAREREGVTGKGVIVGIIDTGIDWCHPDFLNANGNTRILALWDQTISPQNGEVSPDVGNDGDPKNDYGVLYTQSDINAVLKQCDKKTVRSVDTNGHGTHVTGIAAASGPMPGMAPEADLVIVKYTFTTSQQPQAIQFVLDEAKKHNKPVVINMSLGTSSGPKDGTSLAESFLTSVVGPGKNIVVAAGNSGRTAIFASGKVDAKEQASFQINYSKSSSYKGGWVELYTHLDDIYEITIEAPDGKVFKGNWGRNISWKHTNARVYLYPGTSRLPLRRRSSIGVIFDAPPAKAEKWTVELKRTGTKGSGSFYGYVSSSRSNVRFASSIPKNKDGSIKSTIGAPASSPGALSVASYSMRSVYDTNKPSVRFFSSYKRFGELATSSSRGPTPDGRIGIHISAPGQYIHSSHSAELAKGSSTLADTRYRAISGTSMAAPMVAGAAALVLERDPQLFVRPLFQNNGRAPDCCINPDRFQWGGGMLSMDAVFDKLAKSKVGVVKLVTKSGLTQGQAPWKQVLEAQSQDSFAEYHWDLDGDKRTDQVTTTPSIEHTFSQAGTINCQVVAYNLEGRHTTATLSLLIIPPPQPPKEPEPTKEPTSGQEPATEPPVVVGEPGVELVREEAIDRAGETPREPTTPFEPVGGEPVLEPVRDGGSLDVAPVAERASTEPLREPARVKEPLPERPAGVEKEQGSEPSPKDTNQGPPPGDACGCQIDPAQERPLDLGLLLVLFVGWVCWRRR